MNTEMIIFIAIGMAYLIITKGITDKVILISKKSPEFTQEMHELPYNLLYSIHFFVSLFWPLAIVKNALKMMFSVIRGN